MQAAGTQTALPRRNFHSAFLGINIALLRLPAYNKDGSTFSAETLSVEKWNSLEKPICH